MGELRQHVSSQVNTDLGQDVMRWHWIWSEHGHSSGLQQPFLILNRLLGRRVQFLRASPLNPLSVVGPRSSLTWTRPAVLRHERRHL